jgi:hypothetical protein
MRSHFISGAAIACAVTGATAMMPNIGSAQIAYDAATDATYAGGWSTGQNAGYGFGAWSFDQTQNPDNSFATSGQQEMSNAGAIGTAWTLFNLSSSAGLANAGRAISEAGGLQTGQTFETVIQNPSTSAGYYTYRGWDLLFLNGTDNNAPGNNTAALRLSVFDYYNTALNWAGNDSGSFHPALTGPTTAAAGARIDLTLTSATTYSLKVTPLNGATPYTRTGTLGSSLPINYVDFRLYNTAGNDVADNYGISYVEIVPEPATFALVGMGFGGLLFFRRRK